ncbi:MAG: 6-phosphogluconolactonase [Chloroflexi bacterium]|nr:6-phosphogluconolactonase [Chloroflexota bacterium]
MSEIRRYPDANRLAHGAAELFIALSKPAIAEQGRFTVALSGGSTPKALFNLLAHEPYASQIEWSHVHIFWGDERCVPPDHPDSNYRMARETLLQYVPLLPENIHPMHGDIDPAQASAEYEQQLRIFFGNSLPEFDLILLGMGDDGHTASLFPGTAAVHEQNRWVIGHFVEKLDTWRLTLTPPALNAATNVAFLVAGQAKAERLHEVLKGLYQPDVLPAQIIQPTAGHLFWMVDEEAASLL